MSKYDLFSTGCVLSLVSVVACGPLEDAEVSGSKVSNTEAIATPPEDDTKYKIEKQPCGPCNEWMPENCACWRALEEDRIDAPGCTSYRKNRIDDRWEHRMSSYLGDPTSGYRLVGEGCRRNYENGTIYAYEDKAYSVRKPLRDKYEDEGGPEGDLGFPTTSTGDLIHCTSLFDCLGEVTGWKVHFTDGSVIAYYPDHGAYLLTPEYWDRYVVEGGAPVLGYPMSDQQRTSFPEPAEELDGRQQIVFQGFESGILLTNDENEMEALVEDRLEAYLRANPDHDSDGDDVFAAEQALGLPQAQVFVTAHGEARHLGNGVMFTPDGEDTEFYDASLKMIDGRMVRTGEASAVVMRDAIDADPYLPKFRRNVARVLLNEAEVGRCEDVARDRYDTNASKWCSEFVSWVYLEAGMDNLYKWVYLSHVTYAKQLRWIFQEHSSFVYAASATELTAETGDYVSVNVESKPEKHSSAVITTSLDSTKLWTVGGSEEGCVQFTERNYFRDGVIDGYYTGFGKLAAHMF